MANYICPVCGKNCNNLNTLKVCVGQHIQDEKEAEEAKTKEVLDKKKKLIINKGEELLKIVKEYNAIAGNPMSVVYSPPYFMTKCERTKKDIDLNIDKKIAGDKAEFDLSKMINELTQKIKNVDVKDDGTKRAVTTKIESEEDLDDYLGILLKNLFI